MKIADLNPKVTPWKRNKVWCASSWKAVDTADHDGNRIRDIMHYGTLMGFFAESLNGTWYFQPVSTGWGSASDQQGIRKLECDILLRRRKGDAWYECQWTGNKVVTLSESGDTL